MNHKQTTLEQLADCYYPFGSTLLTALTVFSLPVMIICLS